MELSPVKRHILGFFVLLLVDFIWVGSSELSEFVFNESGYNKPFFSTYLKTSMFSLYLLGFLFWKPWRQLCVVKGNLNVYRVDAPSPDDQYGAETSSLSEPSYEPLKVGNEKASDVESDDSSVRSVRFSRMAEVRQLSETDGVEAMFSRLSYTASQRAEQIAIETANKLPVRIVMVTSLIFCFLFFFAGYAYQLALSDTEAAIVNVVSSSSSLFTLILAAFFPSSIADRFSLSKMICVSLMILGTVMISFEEIKLESTSLPRGVVFGVLGSILYAAYIVFLKWKVPSEEKMDFTMFFGFVGLFNAVILWPGFILLDITGWETFQVPTKTQLLYIAINGLIGTVLSELLWLWGCFLTSSLMATLSLSLTIPLSMLFDIIIKKIHYSWMFYVGSIPILVSFIFISLLTHCEGKDPLLECLKNIYKLCWGKKRNYRLIALDVNEQESLIISGEDSNHCDELAADDEINMMNHSFNNT